MIGTGGGDVRREEIETVGNVPSLVTERIPD